MIAKPAFKLISGKPHPVESRESPVEAARRRFGQPFAHESGAKWQPRSTPVLTDWLAKRKA